ncbi:hypothetical protein CBR_g41393 [Chara braunii]|uniref:Reverse transcriptase RNase H-like domain-containing protein n=1 Tax=Chara braunii TaxID=69332 RepID=A0A388LVN9_CHABU|nr:hypothetical protein CBR_g41393 [Chara braunii]|eukprot:GBG86397.1 hypothetical protein CBR_g41393 [Chara braunii]
MYSWRTRLERRRSEATTSVSAVHRTMVGNNDNQDGRSNDIRELTRIIQQSPKDQIPKIDVPWFDGNNASGWAEKFEQLGNCGEWSNEKMLRMVKRYCKIQYKEEVEELVQASLNWAEFKRKLLEKYQLSDQLLDLIDLRKVSRKSFGTTKQFLTEFGRVAKLVPDLIDKDRCLIFLNNYTEVEQLKLVKGMKERFAARVEHLRTLIRKNQVWEWGPKQQAAVEDIKAEFREGGLILRVPCFDDAEGRPFIIETDAGPTALGGVLVQKDGEGRERPLRFESRTLNITERNYSQFNKETLAVLYCLRIFRNYVFGRRFILRVHPTALAQSLKNYSPSDPTIARWLTYIWMFNFEIERILDTQNRADGLSRVDWDSSTDQAEDSVPVDGFLEGEESQLSINSYNYLADGI